MLIQVSSATGQPEWLEAEEFRIEGLEITHNQPVFWGRNKAFFYNEEVLNAYRTSKFAYLNGISTVPTSQRLKPREVDIILENEVTRHFLWNVLQSNTLPVPPHRLVVFRMSSIPEEVIYRYFAENILLLPQDVDSNNVVNNFAACLPFNSPNDKVCTKQYWEFFLRRFCSYL